MNKQLTGYGKLFCYGSQFSRLDNDDEMGTSPKAVISDTDLVYGQVLAQQFGKTFVNCIADNSTNQAIWFDVIQKVRTNHIRNNDLVIIQYGSIFEKPFYSAERSNEYNQSSPAQQKTFDFAEEYHTDIEDDYKALFTVWRPGESHLQRCTIDQELHRAYEEASWDGRDSVVYYQEEFFNQHWMFRNAMINNNIPVVYLWKSNAMNLLSEREYVLNLCDNSFNVDDWASKLSAKQRTLSIDKDRLTTTGHLNIASDLYDFLLSNALSF